MHAQLCFGRQPHSSRHRQRFQFVALELMVVASLAAYTHNTNREIVVDDLVGVQVRAQVILVSYGDG